MFSIRKNGILNRFEILRTEYLTLGKALLIHLHLYLQVLIKQISTQTENHMYRGSVAAKKYIL